MERVAYLEQVSSLFRTHPVVAIIGPRQCGKTTLARQHATTAFYFSQNDNYFDLEDPTALARLNDPMLALSRLQGLVIIDEIQRRPELFPVLRVLADRPDSKTTFLILGSASPELLRQTSESLAGRIAYLELTPFGLSELPIESMRQLWLRGGYPRSYLAHSESDSFVWREEYIRTYLERDLPVLGINLPSQLLRRYWTMLAHLHGQIYNGSEIGRSLGFSHTSARRYLDVLSSTFMVRELRPWHANLTKREVKSPKIYFRDTGLLHCLLGLGSLREIESHPKLGASWEGFALEEVVRASKARPQECYFWSVHSQTEVDLLIFRRGILTAYEFKYADAPKMTRSIGAAVEALNLSKLTVVYPGEVSYQIDERVDVKPLQVLIQEMIGD
jgi:predicted AAA+ superfamily ATPase